MNLLLNTGNSTGLTGCPSALLSDELALSEDPVAQFTDTLIEIANQTIPKSHISKNKLQKVPWFNDVCKQAVKERKKAQRKLFRNPAAENVLAFKQLKTKARHTIPKRRHPGKVSVLHLHPKLNLRLSGKQSEKSKGKKIYLLFRSLKSQWKIYHRQETNCKSVSLHHF